MTQETKNREPLIGYMVIDDYADDYSDWNGQIAFPNPRGANLYWENPIKMVEYAALAEAQSRIAIMESRASQFEYTLRATIEARDKAQAEIESLKEQIKLTSVFTAKSYDDEIEKLREENEALTRDLERKSKEIGRSEHRGNTVDYIYDKCATYGAIFDKQRVEMDTLKSKLALAEEKLKLIENDGGLERRMLELFESRRERDEKLKLAEKALVSAQKAICSGYSPQQDAGSEIYNTARTVVYETLKKIRGSNV